MADEERRLSIEAMVGFLIDALEQSPAVGSVEDWGAHLTSPHPGIVPGYYAGDLRVTTADGKRKFRVVITEEALR